MKWLAVLFSLFVTPAFAVCSTGNSSLGTVQTEIQNCITNQVLSNSIPPLLLGNVLKDMTNLPVIIPALTGDVVSASGTTVTTIAPGVVTSAKMAAGAAAGNLTGNITVPGLWTFQQGIQLQQVTVASLPTCNGTSQGQLYGVTDSTSTTFNATLAGSGANKVMAYCNGTNWTVH